MRLRNIPGAREEMIVNEFVYTDNELKKGKWREEVFKNNNPLHIEIGTGKGRFITAHAKEEPNVNFLGIEKYSSVLLKALNKLEEADLDNLRLIRMDADNILDAFAEREADKIYLNFSDPWPKDRHAKRRLTSVPFLNRYSVFLAQEGGITFKTDNRPLFDFSLEQAEEAGWKLESCTYDLHHSEYAEGNVMTEYEERFSSMGNPICRMVISQPQNK